MKPVLNYVNLPDGMAQVVCANCGWKEQPMHVSPFDPAEALVAASVEHLRCEPPTYESETSALPERVYAAILSSITCVRNVATQRGRTDEGPHYATISDELLDEMARNAAQAIVLMLPDTDGECGHCKRPIPDHNFCNCIEPRTP
jgi:hypothetical protein